MRICLSSISKACTTEGLDSGNFHRELKCLFYFLLPAPNFLPSAKGHGGWTTLTMRRCGQTGEEPHRYITSTSLKHGERLKLLCW